MANFDVPPVFRNPKADLVVKSSDNVEFRVHKVILMEGSAILRDMFEHPRPPSTPADQRFDWPEVASTITALLKFMYPVVKPKLDSFEEVVLLARAADKWQIEVALSMLRQALVSKRFLDAHPLKVYAFACEMEFEEEKKSTASAASQLDPCQASVRGDLHGVNAVDLIRLINLRRFSEAEAVKFFPPSKVAPSATSGEILPFQPSSSFQYSDGDLVLTSSDNVEFRVYRAFLIEASGYFRKIFAQQRSSSSDSSGRPPSLVRLTLPWPETAATIDTLLQYIFPVFKKGHSKSIDLIIRLIQAAIKWQIDAALSALKQELMSPPNLQTNALRIYGFTCQMGLQEERKAASLKAVETDPLFHKVKEDFDGMTAVDLLQLIDLRKLRIAKVQGLLRAVSASVPTSESEDCYEARNRRLDGRQRVVKALEAAFQHSPTSDAITFIGTAAQMAHGGCNSGCASCDKNRLAYKTALLSLKSQIDALQSSM